MPVEGKVFAGEQKLAGSIVTLFKDGKQLSQIVTTSNGKFSFELPANAVYIISVTKPGFVTKKFKISTQNVPPDRSDGGNFNPFQPDVTLFEMPTAPEIAKRVEAILSNPIAVYQYVPSEENFNYDEKYTQSIQSKLAELADLQKQAEKEMAEKAKNAALEAQKQMELDKKYKAAIDKADKAFNSKDYPSAKTGYNEASGIKPTEQYPKTKLSEIDKLLADAGKQKEIEEKYKAAIVKGDNGFNSKDYAGAKAGYTEASGIKPTEQYPKSKLAEIDKLLAEAGKQKELDEKYKAAIAKGDNAFNVKDYTTAKTGYTEASGIKPSEQYPKTKLTEIDKLLAEAGKQKEIEEKYKAAIAKGDNAFNSKDYATAKSGYTDASGIKPAEQYPKTKLAEIEKLLGDAAKQKEIDEKYKAAITKGDNAFNSKDYVTAKAGYTEATGVKPSEQYPKAKLAEIEKLLSDAAKQKELEAKQKELDEKYKTAIAKGDNGFGSKDYAGAKASYIEASSLKPSEQYPKTKISEIDKLLAEMSKAGELEKQYKDLIAKADNFFTQKNYVSAKSNYASASALKSSEKYPKDKISEIDKILADIEAQKSAQEKEKQYQDAIAKADKSFGGKDYTSAKASYNEALGIKPSEQYPKSKLAEIDKLLADAAGQKQLDEKYKAAIVKGDNAFSSKDYSSARSSYTEASGLKPSEQYPKTKLAEIAELLKNLSAQEMEKKYNDAISRGDKGFAGKDYTSAKSAYTEASALKPSEQYPKTKLAEIDKILKDIAAKNSASEELNNNYLAAISRGDLAFKEYSFANAKVAYNEALTYKPEEKYPKDKLAEIEKLEKDRANAQADKEREAKYSQAIEKGDKLFAIKNYPQAKMSYQDALSYKPNEKYPKERIAQIEQLLKNAMASNVKKNQTKQPPPISEEEKKKQLQSELRNKYPSGVTEEEYTEGTKTILRRIVIRDDYAGIYTKVTHNWGGIYFFKDSSPITETMFENESR